MRQAVLFYSFIVVFIATAVITLLGVTDVIDIPTTQLNMLLGAFLVETAGAVVALYRRTDFFAPPAENLATALGSGFEALDQISDEIAATIQNLPLDTPQPHHGFLIQRTGKSVAAYRRMEVLTADQLDQLPKDQRDLIREYERSMKKLTTEWKKLKRAGTAQLDEEVRNQMLALLRGAKEDLVGILNFLEKQGIYLDDHYLEVRHLVSEL
jgi:hypothetical protein